MFMLALTTAAALVLTVAVFAVTTNVDWLEVSGGVVHFAVSALVLILLAAIVLAVWFGFIAALGWLASNYPAQSGLICALMIATAAVRQSRKFTSRRRPSSHYPHT